ncbi:YfiR/HmsC family protein [uncultured Dokdonia sp.]|uniref:YfiR/HmsC family protein n=1 Tax=uncultured Dokdonia sp. TaxID=575653 RepID=UPI0030EBFA0C|tara:strand:+ start:194381 stop:196180 length:1800 start_codon:yes stop_codon:yes gene_type:complete
MKDFKLLMALKIMVALIIFGSSTQIQAQTSIEQVSRVQRAIYVFNIAQQVNWSPQSGDTFKIGVLGPDRTIIDFKSIAQKRQIQSKPVEIINFLTVKDIADVDILYVNKKYNFQMPYILQSSEGKGILVMSEGYAFNASMINIVRVGNTFRHQINEELLRSNDFVIAPSLKFYAIKTSQKWQSLFIEAQDSLNLAKQIAKRKDSLIIAHQREINNKNEIIDTIQEIVKLKNNSIQDLLDEDEIQKQTIEEKQEIAKELEVENESQLEELERRQRILVQNAEEIERNQDSIDNQNLNLSVQKKVLDEQSVELSLRENINWLLGIIALLFLVAGFVIYKNYQSKSNLAKQLALQNAKIQAQAEELSQKNEDLEQFAYIASHDLQEPLNTISSFIGLIRNDYSAQFDDLGNQSLEFIEEASERMAKLINVLLEYSRIGKTRSFKQVDCNKLVEDLEKDIYSLIKRKKASITYAKLPILMGSEVELRLLFQNLITNALKFCAEGTSPTLHIEVSKTASLENPNEKMWQFSFKDNGIGIRKDHQERIFSIFQRLHTTDQYKGTGIGLAHCKKIVGIHKGNIWVTSKINEGSTFYFTIPMNPEAE